MNAHGYVTRFATPEDAEAIARIYSEGIEDRIATFETDLRTAADIRRWFEPGGQLLTLVVESDGQIIAWASATAYRPGSAGIRGGGRVLRVRGQGAPGQGGGPNRPECPHG